MFLRTDRKIERQNVCMNNQTIMAGRLAGSVTAPASKSYAQRAIAAALLAQGRSTLTHLGLSKDTEAALEIARNLGATITAEGTTYTVDGGLNPDSTRLNVGESGLSARLFVPIAALTRLMTTINGTGSILRRPIAMMEEPLMALGVEVHTNGGYLPMEVKGPMHGGEITVDGSLSSQFVTGLLMALPLVSEDTILHVEKLKSRPYIDMTLSLLAAFGIDVTNEGYESFRIAGGQRYQPTKYNIEGDWSGASCLLVGGATTGSATIRNLNPVSSQADVAIVDAMAKAGAQIITSSEGVTVKQGDLYGFEFDATDCPDLFPALVALGAACRGVTTLVGTQRLLYKESNRAEALAEVFGAMGIEVNLETENVMRITGGPIHGATLSSHNDHRIAMAAAVAALRADTPVTITDADAVEKSYPAFWEDLAALRA